MDIDVPANYWEQNILCKKEYTFYDLEATKLIAQYTDYGTDMCDFASACGKVAILEILRKEGYQGVCEITNAAQGGHIECLRWLYFEDRIKWDGYLFLEDVGKSYTDVVSFLNMYMEDWKNGIYVLNVKPTKY